MWLFWSVHRFEPDCQKVGSNDDFQNWFVISSAGSGVSGWFFCLITHAAGDIKKEPKPGFGVQVFRFLGLRVWG